MQYNPLNSTNRTKYLGSAKSGMHHWLNLRLAAIIMIPLMLWGIYFLKEIINVSDTSTQIEIIKKPYNLVLLIIFIISSFYHSGLGMQVIIEDYINNVFLRHTLIIFVKIFCLITVIALLVALLCLGNL